MSPLDRLTPLTAEKDKPKDEPPACRATRVARPRLEVADIFRDHGSAWRKANAGHVSLGRLKVMSAIESCRTAALGGHVARCENCPPTVIAYNSCLKLAVVELFARLYSMLGTIMAIGVFIAVLLFLRR